MARRCLVLLAFVTCLQAWGRAADEKPLDGDLKEIQGEWKMITAEADGVTLPEEIIKNFRMTFKRDEMSMRMSADGQDDHKATIKLDAAQTPKTIDLVPGDGPEKGKTILGIYSLDGDKLTIHASSKAGDESVRPKELKTSPETKTTLLVLERVKEK